MTETKTWSVRVAPHLIGRLTAKGFSSIFFDERFPGVPFVKTERCVATGKRLSGHDAHAHDGLSSVWRGLVCIRPSHADSPELRAHETAHLLNRQHGGTDVHGRGWRSWARELGAEEHATRYKNRRRKSCIISEHGLAGERAVLAPVEATGSEILPTGYIEPSEELHIQLVEGGFVTGAEFYVIRVANKKRA